MEVSAYTDGGARGNPGPSAYGIVVYDIHHQIIHQEGKYLGVKTNNEAEYAGLIAVLAWLVDHQSDQLITKINLFSDSELLVRQINGQYKVKSPNLKPLYQTAISLLSRLSVPYTFTHLFRESNVLADQLANQAMDRGLNQ